MPSETRDSSIPSGTLRAAASDAAASTAEIVSFLRSVGLVAPDSVPKLTELTGGVASDIWKVETADRVFVVKRARARLRVAQEWTAPVSRNASEVAWMRTAGAIVPGAVPAILADDASVGAFAMEYLDPGAFPVWKSELARGRVDIGFAAAVGRTVAAIHAATAHSEPVARSFANDAVFHAIRLEPYLGTTARAQPACAESLMALSRQTLATKIALVHGDVSPKNILVGGRDPILLDAECAWFGDPAFDVAFCLNHLLLKCIWVPEATDRFLAAYGALEDAYVERLTWEAPDVFERRAARLLPALMLGRIDGKSPIEYVTTERDKSRVRRVATALIVSPVASLADVRDAWARQLRDA
ncbi:MAG TPA: aminoglycoside phosphotransferase family protein [Casimicrobiaceae bacterium]|nr:aminoglycoside phosphotransferase family protein [Casimicrobiaceae bacterium]